MKKTYFTLSIKRLLPSLFSILFISLTLILIILSLLSFSDRKELKKIGVVSYTDDFYVDMASAILSETEHFETVQLSEDEAKKRLISGEIQGYAVVPENFIESAMKGKNVPFSYVLLKKPSSLSHLLTGEIVESVSVLLTESQRAVYGMRQFLKDSGKREKLTAETEKMSFSIISKILAREDFFETENLSERESPTFFEYYFISAVLVFHLILGMSLSGYMIKENLSLSILLSSRGVSVTRQIIYEWTAFFIITGSFSFFISVIAGLVLGVNNTLFLVLPLALLSSFQFFIYEISGSVVAGTLTQFFSSFLFAYISGYFYPSYFFPEGVRKIASVLPTGKAFALSESIIKKGEILSVFLICFLYIAFFLLLSVTVRKVRTKRGAL